MALYLLFVPLAVMLLARKWKWINTISPMTVLYVIGLLVANFLPLSSSARSLNSFFGDVAVPLAIPLMLMGCSLSHWSTGRAVKTFFSGLLAVLIVTVAGFFLFRGDSDSRMFAQISAVSSGIYTGGIPNIGAIAKAVGMNNETYLYVTSYDLIATGTYLLFVIFLGKNVFRKLLPAKDSSAAVPSEEHYVEEKSARTTPKMIALILALTLAIAAVSYLLASWAGKDGNVNMTILVLTLTTLSIAASFLKSMKSQKVSFDMGLYCVYVFCLSIATSCNIHEMDLLGSLNILAYLFFIIFGSMALQILFARLLKIDGDTVLVCSVSLINSPPFVPLVAALLNNKDVVILGISIGLLGYMLGNYLGVGIYQLLLLFC